MQNIPATTPLYDEERVTLDIDLSSKTPSIKVTPMTPKSFTKHVSIYSDLLTVEDLLIEISYTVDPEDPQTMLDPGCPEELMVVGVNIIEEPTVTSGDIALWEVCLDDAEIETSCWEDWEDRKKRTDFGE